MGGNWLDIDATAVHFGKSAKTVRRWIEQAERLGMRVDMRKGRWFIDVDSINFCEPAGLAPSDAARLADLEKRIADEKRRADAALLEAGKWAGRYDEAQKLLDWHTGAEQEKARQIEALQAELERVKGRGLLDRIFNR